MKHLFIINPAAGSRDRTQDYTKAIEETCSGLDYEIYVSKAPGDCTRRTREAGQSGEETRVYACGGDGTLNEVVNGAVGFPNLAVSVYSGGSGNDFVKLFANPQAFFQLEQLLDAEEISYDLIRCNGEYSLNICSVGLDARISSDVGSYKRIPFLTGFRAYAVSALVNVVRGIGEHFTVDVDGEHIDGELTLVCVCNGQYYGGGFHPVPDADPTDGLLDVLVVQKVSRLQAAGVIGKYKDGRYAELPQFIRHLRTDKITIHCDRPTPINLDGETRFAKTVELSLTKEKLRFFYPKAAKFAETAAVGGRAF